jgi:hypothetical protein
MVRPYGAWIDGIRSIARDQDLLLPAALEFLLPQTEPIGNAPADRSSLFDAVVHWAGSACNSKSTGRNSP